MTVFTIVVSLVFGMAFANALRSTWQEFYVEADPLSRALFTGRFTRRPFDALLAVAFAAMPAILVTVCAAVPIAVVLTLVT